MASFCRNPALGLISKWRWTAPGAEAPQMQARLKMSLAPVSSVALTPDPALSRSPASSRRLPCFALLNS